MNSIGRIAYRGVMGRVFRKVGRALGDARGGDVAIKLLEDMARQRPRARSAAAAVGQMLERERLAEAAVA